MFGFSELKVAGLAAVLALSMAGAANAAVLDISPTSPYLVDTSASQEAWYDALHSTSTDPASVDANTQSNSQVLAYLADTYSDLGQELYKANLDIGDEKTFAANYQTTFSNSASNPSDALIELVGSDYIGDATYLFVKDGASDPSWYLFDLTAWDGKNDIELTGFWFDSTGSISHVSIFGTNQCVDCTTVPEPGPLGLLGFGMVALYLVRRRRTRS